MCCARSADPGGLLRLEDLHWADEDTVALVEHLAGATAAAPLLIAVSTRDDQTSVAARRLATAPGMTTLRLERLDESQVAELAAICKGGRPVPPVEAAGLMQRSEGVPFIVEELVDGMPGGPGVPPTLAGLVDARLAALISEGRTAIGSRRGARQSHPRLLQPRARLDVRLARRGRLSGHQRGMTAASPRVHLRLGCLDRPVLQV